MEFGFLDSFYYRTGRYEDKVGRFVGNTEGYGININYKQLFSISYNYSDFPGGGLQDRQTSYDIAFTIDGLTVYELLRN